MCKASLARTERLAGSVLRALLLGLLCLSAVAQTSPGGGTGPAHFLPGNSSAAVIATRENGAALAPIAFRTGKGMLFSHQWIEIQTSNGPVTLGFGSALPPFIDRGQVTIEDTQGRVEHEYALHVLPFYLDFGRPPGMGKDIGEVVYVPVSRADQIVEQQRHRRFIFPYIPLFHDCRTYVCAMQATVEGKSKLPCYLLLKGYW
jgi:hypothetical protein